MREDSVLGLFAGPIAFVRVCSHLRKVQPYFMLLPWDMSSLSYWRQVAQKWADKGAGSGRNVNEGSGGESLTRIDRRDWAVICCSGCTLNVVCQSVHGEKGKVKGVFSFLGLSPLMHWQRCRR